MLHYISKQFYYFTYQSLLQYRAVLIILVLQYILLSLTMAITPQLSLQFPNLFIH